MQVSERMGLITNLPAMNLFDYAEQSLTPEHQRVWSVLQSHQGERAAIKAADIARQTGLSERRVRRIIAALVTEQGKIIVRSCVGKDRGFYLAATDTDIRAELASLGGRARKILKRMGALNKTYTRQILAEIQKEMF